ISASGHIVIMGACRGTVHAGCLGDKSAFVVGYRMQPLQVKIADILYVSEDKNWANKPQIAFCVDDEIALADYNSNFYKNLGL
ncbi:MAG: septum site-determining protein MinC, partial [Clostridiales bacterium]|nr:septum site-determining protein MinC [Clostridiales bacterium]